MEVGGGGVVGLEREAEGGQAGERAGETVDGVVGDGHGAVAALVVDLEAEADHVFFAGLDVVGDLFAVREFAIAAFVEGELGVDEAAVILEQPLDSAVGAAALFVGGEGDDDVAVGNEAFALHADEVGDPDGGLVFVVGGAAAVEVAVFLGEDVGVEVGGPVFALGFDYVLVGEEEERLVGAGAVEADNEVLFGGDGAAEEDVGRGEAGGAEACGGGFGDGCGRAGGVAGFDLDELLVDVVG